MVCGRGSLIDCVTNAKTAATERAENFIVWIVLLKCCVHFAGLLMAWLQYSKYRVSLQKFLRRRNWGLDFCHASSLFRTDMRSTIFPWTWRMYHANLKREEDNCCQYLRKALNIVVIWESACASFVWRLTERNDCTGSLQWFKRNQIEAVEERILLGFNV